MHEILHSCSYYETIDLVCQNNTIYFNSFYTINFLATFLPPQRFKAITSLELLWPLDFNAQPLRYSDGIYRSQMLDAQKTIHSLAADFPSLERFTLSVTPTTAPLPDSVSEAVESMLLTALEDMMKKYQGKLKHSLVAVFNLEDRKVIADTHVESMSVMRLDGDERRWLRIWRPINSVGEGPFTLGY